MIIELIRKEFLNYRLTLGNNKVSLTFAIILRLVLISALIALEVFIFQSLDRKITQYSSYGTYDFLVLYLFIVVIISIVFCLLKARKSFFDVNDNRILVPLPISDEAIIFSKSTYCYFYSIFINLIMATPILYTFAIGRVEYAYYYVFAFLYPALISLFIVGIVMLLVAFVELIYRLLKLSDFVQFILACLSVIGLCYAYQFVLNMFLTALSDSSVGGLFSPTFVEGLHHAVLYLVPVSNICDAVLNKSGHVMSNVFIFLGVFLVILVIGFSVAVYFHNLLSYKDFEIKVESDKENKLLVVSPFKALLKKEFLMLFKNGAYTFSYTALLIMAPFLSYVVISSLNAIIYQNLEFFSVYYPELINGLNVALIMLFLTIINSGASLSISREGRQLQIVKYLPISPLKQIFAKLIVPICLSFASLLITLVTLIASKTITPMVFGISLIIGFILLFADNVLSIEWDMMDQTRTKFIKKGNLNTLLAIGFPIVILSIHIGLSLAHCPSYGIYLVEVGLSLLLLVPCLVHIKSRYNKAFREMEVN